MTFPMEEITGEIGAWMAQWPDGLIALDQDQRIIFFSPVAEKTLGYTQEQVIGKCVHDLLCSASREVSHSKTLCPLCRANGHEIESTFWVNAKGENVSVDYRVIALSGRLKAKRILSFQGNYGRPHSHEEMEKFTEYVEKSPTPISEFDIDGQMVYGNTALQEKLLLYGFDDVGSARILPAQVSELCSQVYQTQSIVSAVEVEVDGCWYAWHFYPMESGDAHSVMGYAYNISEQKLAEAEAARQKAEARRDFYAKMVHELRTPLNVVIGFSQILQKRTKNSLPQRELDAINAIRSAGLQLNELVTDTLDISKIDAGKMEVLCEIFSVNRLAETFNDQLMGLAEVKQLEYTVHCEEALECYSDPKKIRQIVINLVSNAIKYTPRGFVKVKFFKTIHEDLNESIGFEVSDSGVGIPEAQIHKLFGAYQQVSEEQNRVIQGTGLGLALVSELVQMLHGVIEVDSVVGEGSTFRFLWPVDFRQ